MLNVKDYCITTEKLAELQAAITAYAAETPKPRVALSLRKTYNANLAASFKQADAILRSQMDKMVNALRAAHPDFVGAYESNRIIVDPATTTTKITGLVTNKADDKGIKDATVTATGTSGSATGTVKTATTASSGKYTLTPLPPGDYTITVTAETYKDFTETQFNAKLGVNNHLDVGLET